MTCDEAQATISLRADGELTGDGARERETSLDAHVAGCAACSHFAATVRDVRSRLRLEPIDQAPDLGAAVIAALRVDVGGGNGLLPVTLRGAGDRRPGRRAGDPPTGDPRAGGPQAEEQPREGPRFGRRRLALVAGVAAVAGMAAGATFVGLGTEPRSPAAADVPALVIAAQRDIDAVDSRFTITETGAGTPGPAGRSFEGRLVYRAPESLALSVQETTPGVPDADRDAGRLVVDGTHDRWWQESTRRCSDASGLVRCPDETVTWTRSVTGRAPFSAATPVPLDLVSPVDSFTLSATPPSLGTRTIAGRGAVGVTVTAAQAAPLIDGLAAAVDLGPVHPADQVDLWLDDEHLVPLALVVRAAGDPARSRWAATVGAPAQPGDVVLTMTATDLQINGPWDDDALRIPTDENPGVPEDAPEPDHGAVDVTVADAGFRSAPADDPAVADVPVPRDLPAGFSPHRSGTIATPGGPPVALRSWSDGRAWLTVRATTAWSGGRLFGDLGPDVRGVDLGAAGVAYASTPGDRIALHADGLDVVVTGSLPADELRRVATTLGVVGRPVPDAWSEAATSSLDDAATTLPGLLTATGLEGFGDPAVRVAGDGDGAVPGGGRFREATVIQVCAGPGQRSFTLTQRSDGLLPPPSAGDETGVEVRGTPGRYSPQGGELEWVEDGIALSLRSDSLTLDDLLVIAGRLEPVT